MESYIGFLLVYTLIVLIINSNVDATQLAVPTISGASHAVFDITKLGTPPNGDATQGILCAWKQACAATNPSLIRIPEGEYTLGPVILEGPCKSNITICVNGNFKAIRADKFGKEDNALFKLKRVCCVTIQGSSGGGVFDGQGPLEWSKNNCANNKNCKMMPYNFRFDHVNDSTIIGITSKDSKAFHMNLCGCKRINVRRMTITAPADSPNTDGIHLSKSEFVNITDSKIGTGDDCVSMCDGAKNIFIEMITCGPGHGISIGSVGGGPNELPLMGITVKNCNFTGTDNGVRIKTWLDSYENLVSGILFEDITVDNVKNPIIIDQEYCPYNHCKSKAPSKVKLSDIKIRNIKGTASTPVVVILACSTKAPCEKIEVSNVDLKYIGAEKGKGKGSGKGNQTQIAQFICKGIKPITRGVIVPPPCTTDKTSENDL